MFIVAAKGNALHVCALAVHYAVYLSSKSSALKLGSVFKQALFQTELGADVFLFSMPNAKKRPK